MRPTRPRLANRLLSVEEYLRLEARASVRHEYVAGRVYALAGATVTHERIVRNLTFLLHPRTRGTRCELFTKDLKVFAGDALYYPDLMVRCGERLPGDTLVVTDPCLLVEVLSAGTRHTDRREKRAAYQLLPSLTTYLVVAQTHRFVERYWREPGGAWQVEEIAGTGAVAVACPTGVVLTLDELYAGTDVPERRLRRLREPVPAGYASAAPPTDAMPSGAPPAVGAPAAGDG